MEKHHHYIIHKPSGFLSQFVNNEKKQKHKKLLGELYSFADNTMAIGRLDRDSEGLLLLTTDGKVSEQVRSKKIEKEYYAQLDGIITDDAIKKLIQGVEIGLNGKRYTTLPCKVSRLDEIPVLTAPKKIRSDRHGPTSWVSICISEGKFRQVRKMTAAVGFPTLRLIRMRIGNIHLGNLSAGGVIETENFNIVPEAS